MVNCLSAAAHERCVRSFYEQLAIRINRTALRVMLRNSKNKIAPRLFCARSINHFTLDFARNFLITKVIPAAVMKGRMSRVQ